MNTAEHASQIDTLYIVDFDRTLADSDKLLEVFMEVTNQYIHLPLEQVKKINADVGAKGDSFDIANYVRDHLAAHGATGEWEKLQKQFTHDSRSLNMLLPGAAELLALLEERGYLYGILTYGNPLWQHIKLTAAGFNHVPRIVTTSKHKGRLISRWQDEGGLFHLPHEFGGGVARRVILIDDKAASFDSFPSEPSLGFQVLDRSRALPAQLGEVPSNVTHCTNLADVIALL
ncbi:MAG: hypothetical protein UY35_C0006G0016 [Candidatus Saccharibacteria bacterium GW2011_GWC2_48_9]|nr:MAG: hypothetical protein UY35_C0006G0016 [Candidatus Saccharibacteria bacterium GW2011_GWC2_48_9]HCH34275.1 hypothetical protein [Candidatus Saccharibacteria bacterium]